jgi:hypothetical protein
MNQFLQSLAVLIERQTVVPEVPPAPLPGQVWGDDLPLGIGQITGIDPGTSSGAARTLGTRGPSCLPGRHTSELWARARHLSRTTYHQPAGQAPGPSTDLSDTRLGVATALSRKNEVGAMT